MLNLTQVEAFLAVIDEGGFRQAARRLKTSQPTVTQHIKKLEAELGAPLVKRSHAASTPTVRGERFLPYARRLIRTAEQAQAAMEDRQILIGASSNIGTYMLQPRLKAFLESHDESVQVSLSLCPNPQVADRLTRGELDVGLMEWWDHRPGFEALIWRREPLVVIVSPRHPWAERRSISKRLLLSTPMIGGEPGSGTATLLKHAFGEAASQLQLSMSLGNTEAVKQAVMAGLGVSIVLESAVRDQVDAGLLCALPIAGTKLVKDLFVLLPEEMPPTSIACAFAEHLVGANFGRILDVGRKPHE